MQQTRESLKHISQEILNSGQSFLEIWYITERAKFLLGQDLNLGLHFCSDILPLIYSGTRILPFLSVM